jgi:glycosyltransferase involved in cell wall biosynthesis
MLEALASGVPIVATKTAGTDELIQDGHNGFLIQTPSVEEVSQGITRLVEHENLSAMRQRALETARGFDIRRTVEKYSALFEEVVSSQ